MIITVSHLKRDFKVYKRSSGLIKAMGSIFHRTYETVEAIEDISFDIQKGELVGFIGPNGAGKTTTLKCLSGLLHPSSGEIKVLGYYPYERNSNYLKEIGLVMGQKNQLWWDLPAMETFNLNKMIYGISDDEYKNTLGTLSSLLEVKDLLTTPVRQLSLGQRMKMELIASLIHKPKVLFLDEPTIGLDVIMQKKIREFIAEYNSIYKSTILLTSHYMSDVKKLCKRVIIIDHGRIIYDGNLSEIVEKYSKFKIITVYFKKPIEAKELTRYGKLKFFNREKAIITVGREKVSKIAARLLEKYDIGDLNIEELEIDEIINMVFSKNNK